jgi:hypothetical protein
MEGLVGGCGGQIEQMAQRSTQGHEQSVVIQYQPRRSVKGPNIANGPSDVSQQGAVPRFSRTIAEVTSTSIGVGEGGHWDAI